MEEGMKTMNFREEYMVTRRAFLRSYPLRWEEEDDDEEEERRGARIGGENEVSRKKNRRSKLKSAMKRGLITMIDWGEGKVVLLRKMKNRVAFYLVACHPFGFKTKFLTAD